MNFGSRIRLVLFDAVGTLICPDPPVAAAYQAAAKRFGIELGQGEILSRFQLAWSRENTRHPSLFREPTSEEFERDRWRRIVRRVLPEAQGQFDDLFADLWQHFAQAENWKLFDDVLPAWEICRARQVTIGIASNFDDRLFEVCRRIGLPRIEPIFVSSQIGFSKPDPRFFASIGQTMQLDGNEILLIGDDQLNDVIGGQQAGWHVAQIVRNPTEEVVCASCLSSLADIARILDLNS